MEPLAGITVISLEVAVAAPLATRHLADMGARVIKVERPGTGDFARGYDEKAHGLSSHFVWTNRSKESITLNLKSAGGREVLGRLLTRADVFMHNLAPGAVERLGFGVTTLRKAYPRLVICAISGYGAGGPYRDKKAYDLLIQAESGLLSLTGTPETPAKAGISVADIAAGMYAFSGVLTALLARERTGEGATIEVSMLEALGEWMGFPLYFALDGPPPRRHGASHAAIAPYGPFATGDGHAVVLAVQNEREWRRFCEGVLGRPELATDERFAGNGQRVAHRAELHAAIEAELGGLTRDDVVIRLERARIAYGEMRSVHGFRDHPQLAARDRWRAIDSPVGPLPALLPPVNIAGVTPRLGPVPRLGEHTAAILAELGYDEATIVDLRDDHVI